MPIVHNRPLPTFKVDVDTVFVKVAVTDPLGRYVTGLEKEHFRIYEDKIEQSISHFSQQTAPISMGIIFDVSGSMGYSHNIRIAKNWFVRLFDTRNPEDEYLLITFNHKVNLIQAFTDEGKELQNDVAYQKAGGRTAVYDAVYRGLEEIKKGKNEKKALILITDGEDNSSRYTSTEVREYLKESDVQVYGIGFQGPESYGYGILNSIAKLTGGRAFLQDGFGGTGIDYYLSLIHTELRNQYLLGYVPNSNNRDGKYRRIAVKLDTPRGFPKMKIRTRDGYYAPKD